MTRQPPAAGAPAPPTPPAGEPGWAPAPPTPPGRQAPRPYDTGPGGHWAPPSPPTPPGQPGPDDTVLQDPWAPAPPGPQAPGDTGAPTQGVPPVAGGGRRRRLIIAGVALAVLAVVGLGAWWALRGPDEAERDGGGDIVAGGDLSAFSFRQGDCWNDPPLDQVVATVSAVPCTAPHDAEVYAVFDLELDEFPGDDEIGALAEAGCIERFAAFAGVDYASSQLEVVYLNPTQESWDAEDDRSAVCSVSDPAAPTTGSLRGAAR